MTPFEHLVHTSLAKTLGWTLVHSLWEAALAAVLLLAVLVTVRSARVRYVCACLLLASVLAGFALTFGVLASRGGGNAAAAPLVLPDIPKLASDTGTAARFPIEDALPWLAPIWLAGVVVFQIRAMAGWMAVSRLRRRGVCSPPAPWPQRLRELGERLRVTRPVVLLETCLSEVPVVIGYLRPVILVPAGMLAGMPAAHVEAILLHELSHIRRHDYLVNLLQTAVEGILFYHPAVWWISGVIRAERENCCDDLAAAAGGDVREYAAALAALEQNRWVAGQPALAATGGSLVKRIRRLLYRPEGPAWAPLWSAGILTVVAAGALVAWQANRPAQPPQPASAQPVSPYTKWLEEDVVYIIDSRERTAFQSLRTDAERDHFIEQFWLRRDPTPGTPENEFKTEHYRRIAFANGRFASNSAAGWRTDRGRIYILFGPPDEIESHPSGQPPASDFPFEQWLYHHIKGIGDNVIIDFTDEAKTGEYRMTKDPHPGGRAVPRP